jgi:nicotinamide-nucleotide amidase
MKDNKAILITIGDELLMGQTIDTNSAWMAVQLNAIGIDVVKRIAVGDNKESIKSALDEAIANSAVVLLTGGLGPTADDITKPFLCEYFGGKLIVNATVLEMVTSIFEKRGLPMLERNSLQATVPDNCRVLLNHRGTAPGMWFEKEGTIIISMPGVPFEMMGMMEQEIIPEITATIHRQPILHRHIMTMGIGESFLAEKIASIENALPAYIKLAYLPTFRLVRLRLTGKHPESVKLQQELESYQQQIAKELEEYVISLTDEPFEKLLQQQFIAQQASLAIAESCTGGYMEHVLTQVPGASQYFKGGIVCYTKEAKEQLLGIAAKDIEVYSVVSENITMQMAEKVRMKLGSDYGLGITGWLSDSDQQKKEDTGLVWIAVTNGQQTQTKKFKFHYNRVINKEHALQMACFMLWKFINGKES